ncbi:MAG: dipeptide/oligopeptide/nickel ABC transporter ATP-binding protein [Candidatus Solibacter sp.]
MPPEPLLAVRDLSIELRRPAQTIVRGISFEIPEAAIVGLCGDSGSGKTTLALALLKLLPPEKYRTGGQIVFGGRDLLALGEDELERVRGAEIALIFQDPLLALNPVLTVRRQITEILRAHRAEGDPAALLALAGIGEPGRILAAYPHQLSGGERQRVTIAQALACRPKLIVADEPFTALDAPRVVELAALFRHLRDTLGTSFLIVSHHPGTLAHTAGRTLTLHEGCLVEGAARAR